MNYRLLTGCFAGAIVEDDCILDVDFNELDKDMHETICNWAETQIGRRYVRISSELTGSIADEIFLPEMFTRIGSIRNTALDWDKIKEDYENSWDSEETDEEADLKPFSA